MEPLAELPFDPTRMTEDNFLSGESEAALDVDPIMAKSFERMLREVRSDAPALLELTGNPSPSDLVPGYTFQPVEGGLLLIDSRGIEVGGYLSCDLSIDPAHQGQGLGAELVLEYAMRHGDLPTWWLDAPAYSPAGEAAHRAAWRLAHDRALFACKAERLSAAHVPPPGP